LQHISYKQLNTQYLKFWNNWKYEKLLSMQLYARLAIHFVGWFNP